MREREEMPAEDEEEAPEVFPNLSRVVFISGVSLDGNLVLRAHSWISFPLEGGDFSLASGRSAGATSPQSLPCSALL